jgi:hypothetical protein
MKEMSWEIRSGWDDNFKTNLKDMRCEDVNWIETSGGLL